MTARRRQAVGSVDGTKSKWHVIAPIAGMTHCGRDLRDCGPDVLPARMVPEARRCRAVGCRSQWPAHLRAVS